PRSAPLRLAPERSARAPPCLPEKKRSCASRISLTRLPLWVMLLLFLSPINSVFPLRKGVSYFTGSCWTREPPDPEALILGGRGLHGGKMEECNGLPLRPSVAARCALDVWHWPRLCWFFSRWRQPRKTGMTKSSQRWPAEG